MCVHCSVTMVARLVVDALSGSPLRTDGEASRLHRTRRDQHALHRHREARDTQAEAGGGGGFDISTLPDNMTHIVVRSCTAHLHC